MRLKLDENLPASAATRLAALGHDVHTVSQDGWAAIPTTTFGKRRSGTLLLPELFAQALLHGCQELTHC